LPSRASSGPGGEPGGECLPDTVRVAQFSEAVHDALLADNHTIVSAPIDGPFGRTFTFADPDGYRITLHDRT